MDSDQESMMSRVKFVVMWSMSLQVKLGILAFLGGDVFLDQNIVSHLVVATADNRHAVASSADRSLKKIVSSVDWNSHPIISKLYSIFQGTVVVKGQVNDHQLKKLKVLYAITL